MKHVLQLRFLVLFNVWWISWNVFVCANEESNSSSNEPETRVSGLGETGALLSTISERPPNYTNTIVVTLRGIYTSDDISGGQSSAEVTSTKPVKAVEKVKATLRPTIDGNLSSFTGNEEHSSLTTEQQVNNENTIKTKSTFETFNSQSVSYGEVTPTATYSMAYETETTATDRSLSSTTGNEEGHTRMTTEQQENSESVNKTSEKKSMFEFLSSQLVGHHGEVTTNAAYSTVDKTESVRTERRLSNVTGNEEQSSMTTQRQDNSESVDRTSGRESSIESLSSQLVGNYGEVTANAAFSTVNKTESITTERSLSNITGNQEENSSMTIQQQENGESVTKTSEKKGMIESLSSQSVGYYGKVTTHAAYTMVDETNNVTTERNLSSVTGNEEHSSMTVQWRGNSEDVTKTNERKNTTESLVSQSVSYGEVTTTAAYSMDDSNVTTMTSEQNNQTGRQETSMNREVTEQVTLATSESEDLQANTSNVSQGFTAQTSLPHSQSTTSAVLFPTEDPVAPTNITSVNVTDTSVTLLWFQAGLATSFSVTVDGYDNNQHNTIPRCFEETIITNLSVVCNWTWVTYVIPNPLEAGETYNSTIEACFLDRCENASHTFQTAPAQPGKFKNWKVDTQSVNISWYQKGVASNFSILVSDPSARVRWDSDDKTQTTVWGFIDQLSTPGQLLTITINAVSGRLKSNNRTECIYTKPSKPDSLLIFDCHDNNLCIQWNQLGIFDSYVISVNDSEANVSCLNSSDTTKNQATVNCTVHHIVPSGSSTRLSFVVNSGSRMSDEMTVVYVKEPAKPEGLQVVTANASTVCFSWSQTGSYDEFDIQISLPNHNYSANQTIPSDGIMPRWCINDLPCPGAAYSLHVATGSHGKRSGFQNLTFRPVVDYLVMCGSKTKESLEFSIRPNMNDDSCPSFQDVERIEYSYHPMNNESCSNPVENSTVFTNTVLNGTRNTNVTGLIAGVTYQVTVWAVIDSIKSKEHVINCTTTVDYVVTCGSQTNISFELSIRPDMKNDSCPSFQGVERIEYGYHPTNKESCSNPVENNNIVLIGTRNTTVTGLIAGVTYQVTVWAFIDNIRSEEHVIKCTTKPNPPSRLHIVNVSSTNMMLNWTPPEGCVAGFLVNCIGQNSAASDSKPVEEANVTCENLTPGALYNVTVSSRLRDNTSSNAESLQFVTVPEPPSNVTLERNSVNSLQLSVEYNFPKWQCTHFLFIINGKNQTKDSCRNQTHLFTSLESNTCYNITVYTISDYNLTNRTSLPKELVSSWTLPQAVSNLSVTSTTENSLTLKWIQPDKNISGIQGYNLMIDNCSEYQQNIKLNCFSTVFNCTNSAMTYELKNLTPSTNYTITIWAVNTGGDSAKQVIMAQTQDLPVYVLTAALIGIIAGAFVIFILTVFILVVLLRKKTKFAVPSARRPSDGLGFHNPTFTPDACESMKPKPIPLDNFIEYLDELHSDSDLRFSAEYALLTELSPKLPQTAAEMEENRTKNRYSNILPFDHSRVKLIPLDDDDQGSDYINASYMPGYVSKREFIAAQGPMKSTVDDFWRMIWEQHISTIVMVTNLQERGREKCAEYWPTDEEPVFYGDLQVQMKSESQLNYYIIRILDVKLGEKKRVVKHLHFISWPDFGCPENTAVLLDFVLGVRAHAPSQPLQGSGPILVHCSAGVGRTGTFILVDHLLQRMRGHKTLDIFGLVLDMRNYRCNMLQTEAQYVFAHECIKTAIERQMISSFRNSTIEEEDEECMYQNVDRKDKLQEEEECVYQNCKNNVDGAPV